MNTGVRRKQSRSVKSNKSSRSRPKSRRGRVTQKLRISKKSRGRKSVLPRTAKILTREMTERAKFSRANSAMNLTELQILAKSRGIPFGALSKAKLIRKINNYY